MTDKDIEENIMDHEMHIRKILDSVESDSDSNDVKYPEQSMAMKFAYFLFGTVGFTILSFLFGIVFIFVGVMLAIFSPLVGVYNTFTNYHKHFKTSDNSR